jgi:hypothetical protein
MGLLALAKKTVKELIEEGYPESVAKKIADGTLPMDEASRQARADAMSMTDQTYYRGHSSAKPPTSNDDMFVARDRRDIAETYASGGEAYDEATDSYITLPGEVTPLRTNASKFIEADGMGDDWTYPTVNVPGVGPSFGTDEIARNVKRSREIQGNGLQGSLFTHVRDDIGGELEPGDVANILGSQPEVKIRHADKAAFDPEYNGSSIMGGGLFASALAGGAALSPEEAEAGVAFGLAKGIDFDRLISTWQKRVSREPDIDPSTHLQNIIHDKGFTNYNDWTEYARKADGGKNGETYFNELKPFLIDISKHPKVAKDARLKRGLVEYADTRFAKRIKEGHKPDGPRGGQRGSADPYSLLPVAGIGAAAASLAAPHIKDSGIASPVRSETLGDVTTGLRQLGRNLEGSPASLLYPEGLVDYLETVNRETEDPNAMTRVMALADFL